MWHKRRIDIEKHVIFCELHFVNFVNGAKRLLRNSDFINKTEGGSLFYHTGLLSWSMVEIF